MSIALRQIKERRFLNKTEVNREITPVETNIKGTTQSLNKIEDLEEKRPPQIESNEVLEAKTTNRSESLPIELKSEIKEKNAQTLKNLDAQTLNYWKGVFLDAQTLKESELVARMLELVNMEINPLNTTKMLSKIFKDEFNGYIKQTDFHSHIWEIEK